MASPLRGVTSLRVSCTISALAKNKYVKKPAAAAMALEGPVQREEHVYMAKLAEQGERYDEMVEEMKKVAQMVHDQELSVEERNLLSVAYKNVIGARRASWRIISSIEQKEESKGNEEHVKRIKKYREVVRPDLPISKLKNFIWALPPSLVWEVDGCLLTSSLCWQLKPVLD